jgi:hypothetical protein
VKRFERADGTRILGIGHGFICFKSVDLGLSQFIIRTSNILLLYRTLIRVQSLKSVCHTSSTNTMKATILTYVKNYLDQRMQTSLDAMNAAQESANGESKSSAGDKYETSRAMGHLDRDMHARMYQQTREERKLVERIDESLIYKKGASGALIKTTMGDFFLSVSIGNIKIDEKAIMIISPQSPIGALLMGKMVGDKFSFRGKEAEILTIE